MNNVKYGYATSTNNKAKPMSQEFNQTVVNTVANQGAKIGFVWFSIGITTWAEAASFLAFVLSALALIEWLWKKLVRPFCVSMGWLKPTHHRVKLIETEDE